MELADAVHYVRDEIERALHELNTPRPTADAFKPANKQ